LIIDGRITLSLVDGQTEIKYQHLNPETHFHEIVQSARAVVLAGGTMSPVSVFVRLLGHTPNEKPRYQMSSINFLSRFLLND
jgi:chromosome transmission fidelity protein 1